MSTLSLRSGDRSPGRSVLVLADPVSVTGGSSRARVLARRRLALKGLVASLLLAGVLALVNETLGAALFVIAAGATVGYVGVLRSQAVRAREARLKTRRLVPRTAGRRSGRMYAPVVRPQHMRRTGT